MARISDSEVFSRLHASLQKEDVEDRVPQVVVLFVEAIVEVVLDIRNLLVSIERNTRK